SRSRPTRFPYTTLFRSASAPQAVGSDAIERGQSPQELERVGEAALWSGDHQHSISARQRAYRAYLEAGDRRSAARVALALSSNRSEEHSSELQSPDHLV